MGTVLRNVLPRRRHEEEKKQRGRGGSSYEDVLLSWPLSKVTRWSSPPGHQQAPWNASYPICSWIERRKYLYIIFLTFKGQKLTLCHPSELPTCWACSHRSPHWSVTTETQYRRREGHSRGMRQSTLTLPGWANQGQEKYNLLGKPRTRKSTRSQPMQRCTVTLTKTRQAHPHW